MLRKRNALRLSYVKEINSLPQRSPRMPFRGRLARFLQRCHPGLRSGISFRDFYICSMTKLDEILSANNFSNHDLVEMLPVNLNHKMVQKARLCKKPVPKHTQDLILQALNKLLLQNAAEVEGKVAKQYKRVDVFGNDEAASA